MKECVTYVSGVYCTPSPTYSLPLCKTKTSLSHPIPHRHQDRLCSKDRKTVPTHAQHNATERKQHSKKALHACTHAHTHLTHISKLTQTYKKHKDKETHLLGTVCVVLLGDDIDHLVVLLAAGKIWSQTEHAHTEQHVIRHRQTALLVRK